MDPQKLHSIIFDDYLKEIMKKKESLDFMILLI